LTAYVVSAIAASLPQAPILSRPDDGWCNHFKLACHIQHTLFRASRQGLGVGKALKSQDTLQNLLLSPHNKDHALFAEFMYLHTPCWQGVSRLLRVPTNGVAINQHQQHWTG
jgi:hypothetical protein